MSAETDATEAIAERLVSLEPYSMGRFSDRGIVVCAGGVQMFANAYVLVRVLRDTLQCALPIQLWHLGPRELSPVMRSLLEGLGVEPIDADAVRATHPARIADGWQLKLYAVHMMMGQCRDHRRPWTAPFFWPVRELKVPQRSLVTR